MRFRFILSETWNSLKRNVSMIISVMLVTFISFLFIGVSGLMQAQITAAKGEWYDKVEVVVWLCPDGASQAASCSSGKAPSNQEIVDLENVINEEAGNIVSKITYVSREDFYKNTFLKQYPNGEYQGRVLTAASETEGPDQIPSGIRSVERPHRCRGSAGSTQDLRPGLLGAEPCDGGHRGARRRDDPGGHHADRHDDSHECRLA